MYVPELIINVPVIDVDDDAVKVPEPTFKVPTAATETASSAVTVVPAISIIPSVTVTASKLLLPPIVRVPEACDLFTTIDKLASSIAEQDSPALLEPLKVIFSLITEPPAVPIKAPPDVIVKSPPIVKSSSPAPEFKVASLVTVTSLDIVVLPIVDFVPLSKVKL